MQQLHRVGRGRAQNLVREICNRLLAGESKNFQHVRFTDWVAAKCDELIEHRFRVAQPAFRAARDCVCGRPFERKLLLIGNKLKMLRDQIRRDAVKIEALAAAQDRRQDFLRLGRCKNELHMRRRLLQCFEQRVKGGRRKHVHFVDEINFVTSFCWRVANIIAQFPHVLDTVVARAVDFNHVKAIPSCYFAAVVTHATRRHRRSVYAIERLGQNARSRCFADTARTDKKIGMRQTILRHRIF